MRPRTMGPVLPTELIELIVESLDDQKRISSLLSLCSAARWFVNCSQRHIFRSVTLYHPVSVAKPGTPRVHVDGYRKAILFAKTVKRRPDLALYVEKLVYWMPSDAMWKTREDFPIVLEALERMSNVSTLTTGFDQYILVPPRPQSGRSTTAWCTTIASLIQRPTITHLILRNLFLLPLDVLKKAPQLQTLEAYGTQLEPSPSSATGLQLKTLRLDGPYSIVVGKDAEHSCNLLGLPTLVDLGISVGRPRLDDKRLYPLRLCPALRSITVHYTDDIFTPTMRCPLDELNPSSFLTLTHLTIKITHEVTALTGGLYIDPRIYLPACGTLRQLRKLKTMVLHIYFGPYSRGELRLLERTRYRLRDYNPSRRADMYDVVSDRSTFPVLREFLVNIHIRSQVPQGDEGARGMADNFCRGFKAAIEPITIDYVVDLRARGTPIQFVLNID